MKKEKPEKTESYRIWIKSVKALRKVERKNKQRPNLSRTILFLVNFYESNQIEISGEPIN